MLEGVSRMRKHLALCVLLIAPAAFAQAPGTNTAANENAALEQKIRDLEDRIVALEGQVRMLKSQPGNATSVAGTSTQPAAAPTPSTPAEAPAQVASQEPVHLGGAGTAAAKALTPDISMIGDF